MNNKEINALVADKVMGLPDVRKHPQWDDASKNYQYFIYGEPFTAYISDGYHGSYTDYHNVPNYCDDIAAAWVVLDKIGGYIFKTDQGNYFCGTEVIDENYPDEWWFGSEPYILGKDVFKTAPMAICLAALKSKGVSIDV